LGVVAAVSEFPGLSGRERFLAAVEDLQAELASGAVWENDTLERFLDGFGALVGSIENAYLNAGKVVPDDPWEILADALRGARSYE
jgi:hypothetical protein